MISSSVQGKERERSPQTRQVARRATDADSGSSRAAAQLAMANLVDISRRQKDGEVVDTAYLSKVSRTLDPTGSARRQPLPADSGPRGVPSWMVATGLAGIACLLATGFVAGLFDNRHSVAGGVLLDKNPLAGVELQFHDAQTGREAGRVTTSKKGEFEKTWLPNGTYKVTVHPAGGSPATFPERYSKPESTQLQLNVDSDVECVWMRVAP